MSPYKYSLMNSSLLTTCCSTSGYLRLKTIRYGWTNMSVYKQHWNLLRWLQECLKFLLQNLSNSICCDIQHIGIEFSTLVVIEICHYTFSCNLPQSVMGGGPAGNQALPLNVIYFDIVYHPLREPFSSYHTILYLYHTISAWISFMSLHNGYKRGMFYPPPFVYSRLRCKHCV